MSEPYRLTAVGNVLAGGRWNVRHLMPAVYFSTTAETSAAEADAKANRYGWTGAALRPQTRVAFHLNLQATLDLTDNAIVRSLRLKIRDLTTCDWAAEQTAGREAITQAVARAAFENLIEGLVVPSAQLAGGVNIVVFPAHLSSVSTINAHHAAAIPFVHGLP